MRTHSHPTDDSRLDAALAQLREEVPAEAMRREAVWSQIDAVRCGATAADPRRPSMRLRWQFAAAAAVVLLLGGSLVQRETARRNDGATGGEHSTRAVLAEAGRLLSEVSSAAPESTIADSLRIRSAIMLASSRAIADRPETKTSAATLAVLRDVEYALAQVVEGGLGDPIERQLTVESIRAHRVVERAMHGGL